MTVNINPPNFSGLAAAASNNTGNVNLPVPGALGLKGLELGLDQENARRQAMLEMMRQRQQSELVLQQQGLLSRRFEQDPRQMLLRQQDPRQLQRGPAQPNPVKEAENQFLESSKMDMAKLLNEGKDSIKEKGSFAAYAKLAMDKAKTPEEANQIRTEILKEALTKKYIDKEEAVFAAKLPISQFKDRLSYKIMQYGVVHEYNAMADKSKKEEVGVSGLTAPTKTKAQQDISSADENIRALKNLYDNVPEKFFGISALGQKLTKAQEIGKNIPIVGSLIEPSAEAKESLKQYSKFNADVQHLALTIIKQLSGVQYSDKQLEFLKEILPDIGVFQTRPELKGRAESLIDYFNYVKRSRKELLSSGVKLTPEEYETQLLDKMEKYPEEDDLFTKYRNDPRYKDASDEDIKEGLKRMRSKQ